MSAPATRESDERLLSWIKDRARGVGCKRIAAKWGVSKEYVMRATNAVRSIDQTLNSDAEGSYW